MGENGVQEDVGMDLALPWELQSSSPALWGRSRSHQDAESVPGREERPRLKFYRTQEGAPTAHGVRGHPAKVTGHGDYRAESAADNGPHLALPQAFWVTKATQSLLRVSVPLSTQYGAQTKEVLSQRQVDSKLKTTKTKRIDSHGFQQPKQFLH